jgi:hypothetical protein
LRELPKEAEFEIDNNNSLTLFRGEKRNDDGIYPDEGSGFYVKYSKQWKIVGIMSHRADETSKKGREVFMFVNIENMRSWMDEILNRE